MAAQETFACKRATPEGCAFAELDDKVCNGAEFNREYLELCCEQSVITIATETGIQVPCGMVASAMLEQLDDMDVERAEEIKARISFNVAEAIRGEQNAA